MKTLNAYKNILNLVLLFCLLLATGTFFYLYMGVSAGVEKHTTAIEIVFDDEVFLIPRNYLSPYDNIPGRIRIDDIIEINFTLPDFRGLATADNNQSMGAYDKDQVRAYWTKKNEGTSLDANNRLNNAIKYRISVRDESLDYNDFTAYRDMHGNGVTYIARSDLGYNFMIHCLYGGVNDICRLYYFDRKRVRGVFATFNLEHLSKWQDISEKIGFFIDEWKQ